MQNPKDKKQMAQAMDGQARLSKLKAYLKRLGEGENLEAVRKDFAKDFQTVEAAEIMQAEQELLREKAPLAELEKLCDLHSALFHGATVEEKIARAEKEVAASWKRLAEKAEPKGQAGPEALAQALHTPGHPLYHLHRENQAIEGLLDQLTEAIRQESVPQDLLDQLRDLSLHYAKKGDLLYPLLKVRYGISGPAEVMWTVDDSIRDEIRRLVAFSKRDGDWLQRLQAALQRVREMVYKEDAILFPNCMRNFTEEEWVTLYQDHKDYPDLFGVVKESWVQAEEAWAKRKEEKASLAGGEILLAGGKLRVDQLSAMLNTMPFEITFIDGENRNQYFNEGPKVFKRPSSALGRDVFSCHPPKIVPMVRKILDSFRDGTSDQVPVWTEKNGRTLLITYMAVRDQDHNYLGTMELVQDLEFAKEHFRKEK